MDALWMVCGCLVKFFELPRLVASGVFKLDIDCTGLLTC